MNSKCKELVIQLIALEKSKVFHDLKQQSIYEEVGLSSTSETEQKVYKYDTKIVEIGFELFMILLRCALINDDKTIDSQFFQANFILEKVSRARSINCLKSECNEAAWFIINRVFVRKIESFKTIEDMDLAFKNKCKICFGLDAEDLEKEADKLINEKYTNLSKIQILNLFINENKHWIDFYNSVFEDYKIKCEPIEIEEVSEKERKSCVEGYDKCMQSMSENFKRSIETFKESNDKKEIRGEK